MRAVGSGSDGGEDGTGRHLSGQNVNVFFKSSGVNLTFSFFQNHLSLGPRIQLNGTNSTFGSFFLLNEFCKKFKRLDVVLRFALSANASPKYKKTTSGSVILKKQMCSFGRPLSLLLFVFNLKKTCDLHRD